MYNTQEQSKKRGFFSRLFGGIGATITFTRNLIMNLFFIVMVLVIIAAIGGKNSTPLPEKFALRIAPMGALVDQRNYMDTASLLLRDEDEETETVVRDVVDAINAAAKDKRVSGLVLDLGGLQAGGITKMEEIGQAITKFKETKKPVIAISENYSQQQYYLATYADKIYLHPMGEVELNGFGRYITYYKSALDKLGVNVHVFRSGKYKDFVEPYLRDNMSDESREHNSQWLNALWEQYTNRVETARQLDKGSLNDLINHLDQELTAVEGDNAQLALKKKLVDQIIARPDLDALLSEQFGKGSDEQDVYQGVGIRHYLADVNRHKTDKADQVGLIVASGTIQGGHQPEGSIGSESFVELLRNVHNESGVKALVIRIDSGGGSAFASELIRDEMQRIRNSGIPVFISMGSVTASGGYWMATASDEIWAMPTTITGSIGVFGAFPTLENSLQKIGLNTDGISTTELGGSPSLDRPLAPKMANVIQSGVDHTYQSFLKLVADARKKEISQVNDIAQGHVWVGTKAQEIGLVDHLGSLNDVIAAAAEHAKIKDYSVKLITQKLSPKEEFLRKIAGDDASWVHSIVPKTLFKPLVELNQVQREFAPLVQPLKALTQMKDPQGIYATCVECIAP